MNDVCLITPDVGTTSILPTVLENSGISSSVLYVDIWREGPIYDNYKVRGRDTDHTILDFIKSQNPKLVGVFSRVQPSNYLFGKLKQTEVPIVYKGPQIYDLFDFQKKNGCNSYDFGVEGTFDDFPKLVKAIEKQDKESLKNIHGLLYKTTEGLAMNPSEWKKEYFIENVPKMESLFSLDSSGNIVHDYPDNFWVPDSIGCPYKKCKFCRQPKTNISFTPEDISKMVGNVVKFSNKQMQIGLITPTPKKLDSIAKTLEKDDLDIKGLTVWSRADEFLRYRENLVNALKNSRYPVNLGCVGFESFLQNDLDMLDKGTTVEQNLSVIENIRKLKIRYPKFSYENPNPHGLILFNPWTKGADLTENYNTISKNEMWDVFSAFSLGNRLGVYDWNSLKNSLKQNKDNVNVGERGFDGKIEWSYKDKTMREAEKITKDFSQRLIEKLGRKDYKKSSKEISKEEVKEMVSFLSKK